MPRYKSRINSQGTAKKPATTKPKPKSKKKMTTTGDEASETQLFSSGSRTAEEGGSIKVGGSIPVAGSLAVGGRVTQKKGGSVTVGGAAMSDESIDKMNYGDMNHTLNNMDNQQFHIMQGIGAGFLSASHPMVNAVVNHLGGSFDHPDNVNKVATKDILKASSATHLANALHGEAMDNRQGLDTGGGLLDSLKSIFKKGVSGVRKAVKDPRGTLAGAKHLGSRLNAALKKGIEVGNILAPVIPGVSAAVEAAKAVIPSVEKGISIAEQLEGVLGPAEAELIQMA